MRRFLLGVIVLLSAFASANAQSRTPPNIVVIMIDDEDVASLRLLVDRGLMPNLKRYLLDVGDEFTEAFVVGSYGATSRAGFLTGQYPHNHREVGTDPLFGGPIKFNQASTVATWLQSAGYRTALVGRYITGYGVHNPPTSIPPGWTKWGGLVEYDGWVTDLYKININGAVVDFGALAAYYGVEFYQTDVLAQLAGLFIRTPDPRPFFLWLTPVAFNREIWPGPSVYNVCPDPTAPWFPILGGEVWGISQRPPRRYMDTIFGDVTNFPLPQTPSFNEADVSDKPWWLQQTPSLTPQRVDCLQKRYWRRLEVMRSADDLVGTVMTALEETNTLSNTVVVFTGDHGLLDGQHRYPEKGAAYEEIIRAPLVIRTPTSTAPRRIKGMALTIDLAPTIAAFAGATPTHVMDGRSLIPLMQNPDMPWRRVALFQHGIPTWGTGNGAAGIFQAPHFFALRTTDPAPRTFVHYPTVTVGIPGEYYDLSSDPYQLENLYGAAARQNELGQLHWWLNAMKTCSGVVCQILENYFSVPVP